MYLYVEGVGTCIYTWRVSEYVSIHDDVYRTFHHPTHLALLVRGDDISDISMNKQCKVCRVVECFVYITIYRYMFRHPPRDISMKQQGKVCRVVECFV